MKEIDPTILLAPPTIALPTGTAKHDHGPGSTGRRRLSGPGAVHHSLDDLSRLHALTQHDTNSASLPSSIDEVLAHDFKPIQRLNVTR
ncbi:hypothetical protein BIS12_11575, partial [Halomonas sp. 707D7]|nr:hypothetical protein [Halomonas sp. 707D7]